MPPLSFAYYCSGHGYGHATRVSAFACHLLNLPAAERPVIYITSSAPRHVFADSIALGALYRYAEIDPVIVQPLAYRVDRQKSVDVLKSFLARKDSILETERRWLQEIGAHAVLSDAAFLGCLAANLSGIPSILITNFTFDSVYSYLATPLLQVDLLEGQGQVQVQQANHLTPNTNGTSRFTNYKDTFTALLPDIPIPSEELAPLVSQIHEGYRCADLLLLLPGFIPIPSFSIYPSLPAPTWVNVSTNSFHPSIIETLFDLSLGSKLHPSLSIPLRSSSSLPNTPIPITQTPPRSVIKAPLLVRPPNIDVYTPQGRARLLSSIGVPPELHDPEKTKILIVSFGGQVFRAPRSRSSTRTSRSQSRSGTPAPPSPSSVSSSLKSVGSLGSQVNGDDQVVKGNFGHAYTNGHGTGAKLYPEVDTGPHTHVPPSPIAPPRLATPSHIWIPGAPPASKPQCHSRTTSESLASMSVSVSVSVAGFAAPVPVPVPELTTIPPSPKASPTLLDLSLVTPGLEHWRGPELFNLEYEAVMDCDLGVDMDADGDEDEDENVRLLPDESWIAIVCGASKEQWACHRERQGELAANGKNHTDNNDNNDQGSDGLPEGFYVAPKDVYMPDLTAVGDVLLGKLGYGTVSECVDACTPFVYVSRPLFIEEHGLRLLLDKEGVGVELSRQSYEAGDWASAVEQAWAQGKEAKQRKRAEGSLGIGMDEKKKEGIRMASMVVDWTKDRVDT